MPSGTAPDLVAPVTWAIRPRLPRERQQRRSFSPGRLQGEFTATTCWFAPPTSSLKGRQRLLLLFTASNKIAFYDKETLTCCQEYFTLEYFTLAAINLDSVTCCSCTI